MLKRRSVSGYFNNIIRVDIFIKTERLLPFLMTMVKLMSEDRMGFKEMFGMSVDDFEFVSYR